MGLDGSPGWGGIGIPHHEVKAFSAANLACWNGLESILMVGVLGVTLEEARKLCVIRRERMPAGFAGCCIEIVPGRRYVIVLNTRNSAKQDEHALLHELRHVALDHFNSEKSIAEVEAEADGLTITAAT